MTEVKIEGSARIKPTDEIPDGYRFQSSDITDEIVKLEPGDVIVSDGPISFEVIRDD